jgi:hypothetical protein
MRDDAIEARAARVATEEYARKRLAELAAEWTWLMQTEPQLATPISVQVALPSRATRAGGDPVPLVVSVQEEWMKKTKIQIKTNKLHLERQVLRMLQTHELDDIAGGRVVTAPTLQTNRQRLCCA